MKRVKALGGIFFKCKDPQKVKQWYQQHLGLAMDDYGTCFEWRHTDAPEKKGYTQWSPCNENSNYFEPSDSIFMLNYRVENLEQLVQELQSEGINFIDEIQAFEYGKFIHLLDPEGTKIELWEPNDTEFEKIAIGITK